MSEINLSVKLGALTLPNPILTASGTFGYAKEVASLYDLSRLGGIIPKTITLEPRPGNKPPRTVEVVAGLLNAIGLDNDGVDEFLTQKLPWLRSTGAPIIVSFAAKRIDECEIFARKFAAAEGIAALEMNISCPNVSDGVDFGTDPILCEKIVARMKAHCRLPLCVKLSPNVTSIADMARAAEAGGADMISAINTLYGLAVDWRRRIPRIANGYAGYSGPAVKPVALRCVSQIFRAVEIPVIGIGGVESAQDVMEFFVAGAAAVAVGTANFYCPDAPIRILEELPVLLAEASVTSPSELVGTLKFS
ncbi:MAG: dihydroorotate dehydrogenase [Thermoguttaceae bacterium]|jgi:dihydroorotate dehydrogenase (NAD+) catalytic subunit